MSRPALLALSLLFLFGQASAQDTQPGKYGHSAHGSAFDSGLRTKPWKFDGIGKVNFPITTKNPETQAWFNQGIALIHSFWYEEAERSFRWCLKLEPQNPMVYFGLALVGLNQGDQGGNRYEEFLNKAIALKDKASPREQMWISAWEKAYQGNNSSASSLLKSLDEIIAAYPNDLEAKAFACLLAMYQESSESNEKRIQEVLAIDPQHPGAHHYRIHTWDHSDPLQALKSCEVYGEIAPDSGHANHMPGHVYSKLGMWKEAAWSMDKATRVELKYMNDRMAFPFETWNYPHNRTYLIYIQDHLGLADRSIAAAIDLITSPRDPGSGGSQSLWFGGQALMRTLGYFERWDAILNPLIPDWKSITNKTTREFLEALATIKTKDQANGAKLVEAYQKEYGRRGTTNRIRSGILSGELAYLNGNVDEAIKDLTSAADAEALAMRKGQMADDPPTEPVSAIISLGDILVELQRYEEAAKAYETQIEVLPGDGRALAGLALCYSKLGQTEKAKSAASKFNYVYSQADPDLPDVQLVKKLNLTNEKTPTGNKTEREYKPSLLDKFGPSDWQPFDAPDLKVTGIDGRQVTLDDFRGKNVIVVFYLSDECVHCVEQLVKLNAQAPDFTEQDTVIVAVSSTTPAANRESLKLKGLDITLLSDHDHVNARRWASYDDFEEMELHSTILIDKDGRVRWKRTGGDPFTNIDWLLNEVKKVERLQSQK